MFSCRAIEDFLGLSFEIDNVPQAGTGTFFAVFMQDSIIFP
ncbi:MAG: hypothetical protein ACJAXS_000463 [Colwellia sp.]|jgi:hypothetical protein